MPACLRFFILPLPLLFLIFPLYSTQPSPFLGKFSISAYSAGDCSGSLANLTYNPNVVLFANPIVGTGSSCVPYARSITANQTLYFSAQACGQTFFEIGLFADSFCNLSDAQTIYIQIPNSQTQCSSIYGPYFATAVCTSIAPPVAPADASSGSSSGAASPGVIAGSVVGAIACKRHNCNPAHSLITFDPSHCSVCVPATYCSRQLPLWRWQRSCSEIGETSC
jgi:hypothetical protein